ncbi:MAG TPA: DUF3999 family protein, partial [Paraburkholderia sp.]|uniref:DUF3999 family protein n=1 Tax=Paraburkholderia sp. TaxID=1926495 RepID=UPI002ED339D1
TLSQNRIELNGAHARYLRLRWLDGSPYVETIDVEVQAAGAPHLPLADTQREWREGIVAQAGPKAGEYFFSTGGPYPVDRLRLNLPQPNTVAPAVVYSRSQLGAVWREVARATLFRLHNGEFEQNNPSLQLMPDSDRQWRVVVDTRNGGLGTGALTVVAGWRPATLTFVARGSAPYTLGVGNAATVSAALSRDALLTGASSVVATARVGEALKGAEHANAQPTANAHVYRRYMLWTALIFAVGLLATIAWRLARTVVRPLSTAAVPGAAASGSFRGALERGANASEAANSEADAAQNSAQGDAKS